jgi:predicted secreted protein
MRWTSILAIYLLFWVMSAFLVMPFGIRTHEENGEELVRAGDQRPRQFPSGPRGLARDDLVGGAVRAVLCQSAVRMDHD